MEQTKTTLSQGQREMFARLLADARKREEALLETDSALEDRIEGEVLPKLAKERGASDLIAKVRTLSKELEDAEKALEHIGFRCDNDSVKLMWKAPSDLEQVLKDAQRVAKAERQRSLKKFDLAILNVWSAQNADGAKRIVEELL